MDGFGCLYLRNDKGVKQLKYQGILKEGDMFGNGILNISEQEIVERGIFKGIS